MFETILAYLIILAPSVVTLIGALVTIVMSINKIRKNSAETAAIVAESRAAVEQIKSEESIKSMLAVVTKENSELKKSLTLCAEEIKRIHQLHPEWLEGDK